MIAQNPASSNPQTPEARLKLFQLYGFSFFPLIDNSKKPTASWSGYQERHPCAREISNWLYMGNRNYGIVTGSVSGNILGIDLDLYKLEADLQHYIQHWPTGFVVRTPTGGRHQVYRLPKGIQVKSKADALGPGINTRGEGGYLVAPGSSVRYIGKDARKKNVPDGFTGTYEQVGNGEIAPIPDCLLALLHQQSLIIGQEKAVPALSQLCRSYSDATEQQVADMLAVVPPQGSYDDWLSILMAVHSIFPDQRGITLLENWSPGYEGEVAEKFESFEEGYHGPKITLGTLIWLARQHGYILPQRPPRITLLKAPIKADIEINQPYFSEELLAGSDDLILVGDMGTGKSSSAAKLPKQKMIPTHRIRLSKSLAKPFKAVDYRDEHDQIRSGKELIHHWNQGHNLTIVVNSLHLLAAAGPLPRVPILFIDEIRQLLGQLRGETFKGAEAESAFNTLIALIQQAERVIAADAHADDTVLDFLREIRGKERVKVIRNTYRRSRGPLTLYIHRDRLIAKICELIDEDQGVVAIPTNSKMQAKHLNEYLCKRYNADAIRCVHQETTDAATRYFVDHITDEIGKYRAVIYSPTLGSGVDISRDSNGNPVEVRAICAILMANIMPASDCHQLINRCRNTRETHIYIQHREGHRETDADVIYQQRLDNAIQTGHVAHYDAHGIMVASESQKRLHMLLSRIQASDNASLNHLSDDFMRLAQGYSTIHRDETHNDALAVQMDEIAQQEDEHKKEVVLRAAPVNEERFRQLRDLNRLTPEIRDGYERWKIENAAGGQPITSELYDVLHKPADRARLRQLVDYLHASDSELQERDRIEARNPLHKRHHYTRKKWLIARFIKDLYGSDGLHTEPLSKTFIEETVQGFLNLSGDDVFSTFDKRRDESAEPMAMFRWFASEVLGLKIQSERATLDGERTYIYNLKADVLQRQQELAAAQYRQRQQQSRQLWLSFPTQSSEVHDE